MELPSDLGGSYAMARKSRMKAAGLANVRVSLVEEIALSYSAEATQRALVPFLFKEAAAWGAVR